MFTCIYQTFLKKRINIFQKKMHCKDLMKIQNSRACVIVITILLVLKMFISEQNGNQPERFKVAVWSLNI